jgi:GR25 family glycosyltransferase involved in LPS biosynthesis
MRDQLDRAGVDHHRVSARTPRDLPRFELREKHRPTPLQLACLASHFEALERAVSDGHEFFVVMEDDMTLPFDVDFGRLAQSAPPHWEILQLYVVNAERLEAMYTRSYRSARLWERWTTKNHSTGAYVCTRAAAHKLLARYVRGGTIDLRGFRGFRSFPVADEVIYRSVRSYTATYPLYIENAELGSTLDSLRRLHVASHDAIREIWRREPPPAYARPLQAREPA